METEPTPISVITLIIILLVPFGGIAWFVYDMLNEYWKKHKP